MLKTYLIALAIAGLSLGAYAQNQGELSVKYGATVTSNLQAKGKSVTLRGVANQPALMTISVNGKQVAAGEGAEYNNKGT
ncbi:MAG: hypothetical protein K2J23_01600, partial [Muribaculaceae bacterium]|nr:hypothetical protein [Muribaculaceae bacterium]